MFYFQSWHTLDRYTRTRSLSVCWWIISTAACKSMRAVRKLNSVAQREVKRINKAWSLVWVWRVVALASLEREDARAFLFCCVYGARLCGCWPIERVSYKACLEHFSVNFCIESVPAARFFRNKIISQPANVLPVDSVTVMTSVLQKHRL